MTTTKQDLLYIVMYLSDYQRRCRAFRQDQSGDVNMRLWWLALMVHELRSIREALASFKISPARIIAQSYSGAMMLRVKWDAWWLYLDVRHAQRCKRPVACTLCNEIRARERTPVVSYDTLN